MLGHSLCPYADCMFCQFTRQKQSHCSLNFPASDGGSLVVMSQPRSFSSNAFENVIDETVHDAHSLRTDSCVGMDLFQNLIYVNSITLLPFALFLVTLRDILLCLAGFLAALPDVFGGIFALATYKYFTTYRV